MFVVFQRRLQSSRHLFQHAVRLRYCQWLVVPLRILSLEIGTLPDQTNREPSDGSLLRRFRVGEQDAATRLYLRYAKRLHGLATRQTGQELRTRLDPEDIVQSVFRTFFRRAKEGHYQVPDGEELWKMFLVIGLNKIRAAGVFHRAARRDVSRTHSLPENAASFTDHERQNESAEATLRIVIDELLERLSSNQRQIVMQRLEGAQIDEIAVDLRRSKRTVERTLQKFRDLLRQQMDDSLSDAVVESADRDKRLPESEELAE